MTSEIKRIAPDELGGDSAPTPGMTRRAALAREGLWSGLVTAAPRMASGWHHHGENETMIYVVEGTVHFEFGPAGGRSAEGRTGDFVHVPARMVHRETNPQDREARLVITRVGSGPATVNVEGPEA